MPEEWPGQAELHGQLKKLDGISSSKIAVIAKFAVKSVKYYKFVVFAVEHHMKHGDGRARLQGMCIIDAILRAANEEIPRDRNPYPSRFSKNMAFTLGLSAACSDNDRGKIVRIVKIWVSAKLLPEHARREINDWLQKNETSSDAAAIREPTSRLLSSIDKLKEGPLPIAEPVILAEDFDAFDYGDEDDDEARLASQARRLEEQSRKLEAEKEATANAVRNEGRTSALQSGSSSADAAEPDSGESDLHRFGFVRHPDQSDCPAGMVRVLSCVLYIGGIPSGFQSEQLRSQIGSFGKIDDIRIVSGPVANSAFVRYIDREEAESAKNLIRSYCPEYKIGWGKGVGVSKDDFDNRQGIGMVPEASLSRNPNPKPGLPARPGPTDSHSFPQQTPTPIHSGSAPSASQLWQQQQQQQHLPQPQHTSSLQASSSWNGMNSSSTMAPAHQATPASYGAPVSTPPRSIGSVPAAWDGGLNSSFSSRPPPSASSQFPSSFASATSLPASQPHASGWGPHPGAAGPAFSEPPSSNRLSGAAADGRASQRPSWEPKPHPERVAAASAVSDYRSDLVDRPDRSGSSSWDSRTPSRPSFDAARERSSSFDHGRVSARDRSDSTTCDKGPSSWNPGPSSRNAPRAGDSSQQGGRPGGTWDSNPSSGSAWADVSSSGASWGDLTPKQPPSNSFGFGSSSWGDPAPSGRSHSSSGSSWDDAGGLGSRDGAGRSGGAGSRGDGDSWGASSASDRLRRSDSKFDPGPRGGGSRFNERNGDGGSRGAGNGDRFRDRDHAGGRASDRGRARSSDGARLWDRRDEKDFDGGRGPPRNRDENFRGPPRPDRDGDSLSGRGGNGNDVRGGRGGRGRGGGRGGGGRGGGRGGRSSNSDSGSWGNGSSWGGAGPTASSDWAGSTSNPPSSSAAGAAQTTSSSWNDQPSVGAAWGEAPSSGASWDVTPPPGQVGSSGCNWDSKPSASAGSGARPAPDSNAAASIVDQWSSKRGRDDGGWGSLPAEEGDSNKKSRPDGW